MTDTEITELRVCGVFKSLRSLPPYGQPVIVLKADKTDSFLNIRITQNEADTISIAFHNLSCPIPFLHDVMVNVITKISSLTIRCAMILGIEND